MKRVQSTSSRPSTSGPPGHDMAAGVGLQPSLVLPPVPHPHPYEHIAVFATGDGLVMRPHLPDLSPSTSCICVPWGKHPKVQELGRDGNDSLVGCKPSVVVYGIVGIMDLFSASYLLVVTARSHVGCLFDDNRPIYSVKSVRAIPLIKDRALQVLDTITSHISLSYISEDGPQDLALDSKVGEPTNDLRVQFADENGVKVLSPVVATARDVKPEETLPSLPSSGTSTPASGESLTNTNVVKAIADRMSFWSRLSRRQPASTHDPTTGSNEHQSLDSIIHTTRGEPAAVIDAIVASTAPPPDSVETRHSELEARIIRECIRQYVKGCMYFAYHFDITRSLQNKHDQILRSRAEEDLLAKLNALPSAPLVDPDSNVDPLVEPLSTLPLWRRVNREFWWNEWLLKPFIDAGMHSYVLPIVQGHFQVSSFDLPTQSYTSEHDTVLPVGYLIASRRSKYRAGLRYQRRGVDEEAHVANFVETETIVKIKRNGTENVFSFLQIRGSVPLYWTQSGYSLKPPPVLLPQCTSEQNSDTMKRHLQRTIALYGPHMIVNLAEQTGKESTLTSAYKSYAKRLENKDIRYCEYDFHHETRGMKYENISRLIDDLERTFDSQGYFWISNRMLLSKQKGVFRVNCIDCLDRTNVVQSAFARHVLAKQLEAVGLNIAKPQTGRSGVDAVFNDLWANNGDAISRAYAGTSALKGDYTRTGKRDLGGLLNDGVNSLTRMYSATFSDWFCQAVIDFILGYRTIAVFSEFLLKLQSTDPRELIRLSRVRAEAIATSVSRVLEEGEPLLAGWTVIAPEQLNVKISDKFEEKVLLLSVRALYIVRYDYTLEKVKLYTRVPLGMITKITKGAYILSPLEEASRDPAQNAGFSVTWLNTELVSSRMSSYSYHNDLTHVPTKSDDSPVERHRNPASSSAQNLGSRLLRMVPTRGTSKPMIVGNPAEPDDTSFAAFKALPVGSTYIQSGSRCTEVADDLACATTCQEAVEIIVDTVKRACEDIGSASGDDFVSEGDIVSLSEAQRTTSIYAKMEYGMKRLLWLG